MTVPTSTIRTVDDYLARYVPELTQRLNGELKPLYDPAKDRWDPALGLLKRAPFRAQGDALMGLHEALKRQSYALLVGECGVGKTLMGSALAFLHLKDRYRVLIMCPGHLVEKWAREVESTIPEATARIIRRVSDLMPYKGTDQEPRGREYFIIPRDRAKLGYRRKAAGFLRRRPYEPTPRGEKPDRAKYVACPSCGEFAIHAKDRRPLEAPDLEAKAHFCLKCKGPLWEADRSSVRRFAPAEFIKRYLKKGFFDLFLADELHELKGADTAQGNAFGMLASAARKTVGLTGTLIGGYALHLFYILYRINSGGLLAEGLKYTQAEEFVSRYGTLERIRKNRLDSADLRCARGSRTSETVKHRPGVSPLAFARHLLSSTVFVELADVAENLPEFQEDVTLVPMSPALEVAYREIEGKFKQALRDRKKAWRIMGAFLSTLLAYPDRPYGWDPIPEVGTPKTLPTAAVYPKEEKLLEFVKAELAQKRRVWVFATFTNRRDVTERLALLMKKHGIKATVLKQDTVDVSEREAWIEDQVKRGVEVVISNPELVKTGLDLLAFPSLAFYETGFNTFTLMQASRRSWRVGQKALVKVRYYCYEKTLQEAALRLMGQKVKATQALQGKFSAEGLVALTQSEDMMSALAKALMNGLEGVDSAEAYWRNARHAGKALAGDAEPVRESPARDPEQSSPPAAAAPEVPAILSEAIAVQGDLFGGLPAAPPRMERKPAAPVRKEEAQLLLTF